MALKNIEVSYNDVIETLKSRKDQWINAPTLIKLIPEFKSDSQIRRCIHHLRVKENLPIISSREGYKYSTKRKEIVECYELLRKRAKRIRKAEKGLKKAIKNMD